MSKPAAQPEMKDPELKMVMIGKSKAGKSTTGNIILGRIAFESCISISSVTKECQIERGQLEEQNLAVVDTPGLFGCPTSEESDEDTPEKVMEEIKQFLLLAPPGPVVFLVVLQLGSFTVLEQQTVEIIQRSFGIRAAHYTMALFTHGDDLKKGGGSIEEVIGADPNLRDFIRECRGGYHVFDNEDRDFPQVTELLRKINAIIQRNVEIGDILEMSPEDKEVLQKKPSGKEAGRGILTQAYLDGAFVGGCLGTLRLALMRGRAVDPIVVVVGGAISGAVGGMFGAAKCVVCKLIWGS